MFYLTQYNYILLLNKTNKDAWGYKSHGEHASRPETGKNVYKDFLLIICPENRIYEALKKFGARSRAHVPAGRYGIPEFSEY
jgi:hypothetical protein